MDEERFLVTGSEGCIGAWTVRSLALSGIPTVAVDLAPAGTRLDKILAGEHRQSIVHVSADLSLDGVLAELIERHRVTRIVHLAALQVPFVRANPILGGMVNVVGTLRVFEAVRASAGQVRGLAYASSSAAVGPPEAVHQPQTLYGALKLCNEHTGRIYAQDYETYSVGLRPCIVYGPARDQGMTAALTHALKAATLGVRYHIPFGGLVDVQYAEDVAAAFICSAMLDGNQGASVYDLHGDALTVSDFVMAINRVLPEATGLITHADDQIPGNVVVDDADLVARLGGLPKTSVDAGIRASIAMFRGLLDRGQLSADELPGAAAQ